MKLFRKIVDERQELELMRIERSSFWVMFFALFAAMLLQSILPDFNIKHIIGEITVLFIVAVWMVTKEIRCGAWDYFTNPGMKAYIVYSLIGGFSGGSIVALMYYSKSAPFNVCLKMFSITAIIAFLLCFALLLLAGTAVKRRRELLQQESDAEESQA